MTNRFWIGLALVSLVACQVPSTDDTYQVTNLVVPRGDATAGRDAFLELGCASCHGVAWEQEFPEPVSAVEAPMLGDYLVRRTAGNVATSIIAPSHQWPTQLREATEGDLSPMGDFTQTMTVRQLVDVVAYLRTRGGNTTAQLPRKEVPHRTPPF